MSESVDIVKIRQRRRRRRRNSKILIGVLVVGLCVFLYSKRDVWFPKLEGIGTRYQNVTQNENADEEGYYPLSVSGGVDYYTNIVGNHLFILCDMYLYVYESNGSLRDSRQHAYSNAVMHTAGSRSLLYSCWGNKLRVDTASKMLYEKTIEQSILCASINEKGYVAVVTEAETRPCSLLIFDPSGKQIYSRDCVERIVDVAILEESCIFATVGAENGELVTQLQHIRFDENDAQWSTAPLPTLCMRVHALSDGGAFVIGDTKCAYYSSTGALVSSYDYTGTPTDYAYADDNTAILLKNEERRQSTLLLFSDPASAPLAVPFDSIQKSVTIDDNRAYLLGSDMINGYGFNGERLSSLEMTDAYERILKKGKYFYLLGYDKINRIHVKGS